MKKIVFLFLILMNHHINAGTGKSFATGNDLYSYFSENPLWASGYIGGAVDVLSASPVKMICIPDGVNLGQLRDIVKKYLESNPQNRHYTADSVIWLALEEASFVCR